MVYKSGQIFLSFCHNSRVCRTDGRTDRNLITIPRLHYMQRGKNARRSVFCFIAIRALNLAQPTTRLFNIQTNRRTDGQTDGRTDIWLMTTGNKLF